MKKLLILLSFLTVLQFTSCIGKKVVSEKESTYRKTLDSTTSKIVIEKSGPIRDRWMLYIPPARTANPNCDSLCDLENRKLLAMLNMKKESGTNGWSLSYDDYNRMLSMMVDIQGTTNQTNEKEQLRLEIAKDSKSREIPVPYTPKWMIGLAGIGGAAIIYRIVRIVIWIIRKFSKTNPATTAIS